MNREIKFRVWDRKCMSMHRVKELSLLGSSVLAFGLKFNDVDFRLGFNEFDLMQFTGLKDANDKEIYEGDILREPAKNDWEETNYSCFEVFFHDGDANSDYNIGFTMNRMHNHGSVCGGYIPAFKPKSVKKMCVVGNVFENPELLGSR